MSLSPAVLDDDRGVGWHIRASHSCDVVDGARRETHMPPPSNSSPPITPALAISKGSGVQPTRRPHSSSFTPRWGDSFFLQRFVDRGAA